jgi:hypothetical protein
MKDHRNKANPQIILRVIIVWKNINLSAVSRYAENKSDLVRNWTIAKRFRKCVLDKSKN